MTLVEATSSGKTCFFACQLWALGINIYIYSIYRHYTGLYRLIQAYGIHTGKLYSQQEVQYQITSHIIKLHSIAA